MSSASKITDTTMYSSVLVSLVLGMPDVGLEVYDETSSVRERSTVYGMHTAELSARGEASSTLRNTIRSATYLRYSYPFRSGLIAHPTLRSIQEALACSIFGHQSYRVTGGGG